MNYFFLMNTNALLQTLISILVSSFLLNYLLFGDVLALTEVLKYLTRSVYSYSSLQHVVIWFLFLFIWLISEGKTENSHMPFTIMRRRLDVPDALWESHDFFYEDEDSYHSQCILYIIILTILQMDIFHSL
jgi:hypothetical protein